MSIFFKKLFQLHIVLSSSKTFYNLSSIPIFLFVSDIYLHKHFFCSSKERSIRCNNKNQKSINQRNSKLKTKRTNIINSNTKAKKKKPSSPFLFTIFFLYFDFLAGKKNSFWEISLKNFLLEWLKCAKEKFFFKKNKSSKFDFWKNILFIDMSWFHCWNKHTSQIGFDLKEKT